MQTPTRLIALDYDGTLAPYDRNPEKIAIPKATLKTMEAWTDFPETHVAVVSGRELSDIRLRVPPSVLAVGSHGRECSLWPDEAPAFPMEAVRKWVEGRLGGQPVGWNPKAFGLGVDLRPLAGEDRIEARRRLMVDCPVPGVRTLVGKASFEYTSDEAPNKGEAVRRLMAILEVPEAGVLAIGDDATDEDMFRLLGEAWTIHVGEEPSLARFRLGGLPEVAHFLRRTLENLDQYLSAG